MAGFKTPKEAIAVGPEGSLIPDNQVGFRLRSVDGKPYLILDTTDDAEEILLYQKTIIQDADLYIQSNADDSRGNSLIFRHSRDANPDGSDDVIVQDNDTLGLIDFRGADGDSFTTGAQIIARVDGTPGADTDMPTELVFATTPDDAGTAVERMVISPGGKVGVGVVAPDTLLHVQGTAITTARPTFNADTVAIFENDVNCSIQILTKDDNAIAEINMGGIGEDREGNLRYIASEEKMEIGPRNAGSKMGFYTAGSQRVHIDASGKTSVGASTPVHKFHVQDGDLGIVTNESGDSAKKIVFTKSRNSTDGSHTIVQDDDSLGLIDFYGSDGDSFALGARIWARVSGDPANGSMPTELVLSASSDGSESPTQRVSVYEKGVTITGYGGTTGASPNEAEDVVLYVENSTANATNASVIEINSDGNNSGVWFSESDTLKGYVGTIGGHLYVNTNSAAGDLIFRGNSVERMKIDAETGATTITGRTTITGGGGTTGYDPGFGAGQEPTLYIENGTGNSKNRCALVMNGDSNYVNIDMCYQDNVKLRIAAQDAVQTIVAEDTLVIQNEDDTARLSIGSSSVTAQDCDLAVVTNSADADSGRLVFTKSRDGTDGGHSSGDVDDDDAHGEILFQASDGDQFINTGSIMVRSYGGSSNNAVPAEMIFRVNANAADLPSISAGDNLYLRSGGNFGVGDSHPNSKMVVGGGKSTPIQYIYNTNTSAIGTTYTSIPNGAAAAIFDHRVGESIYCINTTSENTAGGRETGIGFFGRIDGGDDGNPSAGTADTYHYTGAIRSQHEGTGEDQKGYMTFFTNDGNDNRTIQERMRIDSTGKVGIATNDPTEALDINSDAIRIRTSQTPASGGTGTAGMICWDANYMYVCTATDTWKRVALTGGY